MPEEVLVNHCSPTLAGLKTANMFVCSFASDRELKDDMRLWNHRLAKRGVRLLPLRYRQDKALIYVYRPSRLALDLKNAQAKRLLTEKGYCTESSGRAIAGLIHRLKTSAEFPHEIGLFLGYPPEDVQGFIDNRAEGCKCVGTWKVYGDVKAAERTFCRFRKCTEIYRQQWAGGISIERLTVTG